MRKHWAALVSIVGLAGSTAPLKSQVLNGGKLTVSQQTLRQQGQLSAYEGQAAKDAQITKGDAKAKNKDAQITKSEDKGKTKDSQANKAKDKEVTKGK